MKVKKIRATFYKVVHKTGLDPLETKRFVKFSVVGVIGAVVDFGTYNLLLTVLEKVWVDPNGRVAFSSSISFMLAIISNFLWNRYWTYPDSRSKPIVRQFVQFFFVNALALLIRLPIVTFTWQPFSRLVMLVPFLNPYAVRIGKNLALMLAVGLAMFWNFFVNRYWTYNDVQRIASSPDL